MTSVGVLISGANQLKAPKKTPVHGLSFILFTFPSVLNVRAHSYIKWSSFVSWMQFLSFVTKWAFDEAYNGTNSVLMFVDKKIKRMVLWLLQIKKHMYWYNCKSNYLLASKCKMFILYMNKYLMCVLRISEQ